MVRSLSTSIVSVRASQIRPKAILTLWRSRTGVSDNNNGTGHDTHSALQYVMQVWLGFYYCALRRVHKNETHRGL
jgi:hypothetical protein